MTLKINFFGASVTQQKDGYAWVFKNENPKVECKIFGYGANHISGAGICYLDDVLSNEPDFLVLDWFSTGYCKEENYLKIREYIDAILRKTINAGVRPIFLFLPQESVPRMLYDQLIEYISKFNVPVLDCDTKFNGRKDILRDTVHTNELGSNLYANELKRYFEFKAINYPRKLFLPKVNKYCEIKKIDLNKEIYSKLIIDGDAEVIGISQTIGPYTGYVKIGSYLEKLWDRWCYYERNMMLLNFIVNGRTEIEVLQYEFDRSSTDKKIDWPTRKYLKLMTLYYSGERLEVSEIY